MLERPTRIGQERGRSVVAFLLIALLQNTERRGDRAI
jgi:hypothetical protein